MPDPSTLNRIEDIDIANALSGLNARIEFVFNREHQIGHAYFMGCTTRADLEDVMREKVIPLLVEYFYDDWSKIWRVLNEPEDGADGAFLSRVKLAAPKGTNDSELEDTRWRYVVRPEFDDDAFDQLAQ